MWRSSPETEKQIQAICFLWERMNVRATETFDSGNKDLPRCRYSSGSMIAINCCNVDSCFFMPLWSRKKFCFWCPFSSNTRFMRWKFAYHAIHDFDEAPKGELFVAFHYHVDRGTKVWHSLYVSWEENKFSLEYRYLEYSESSPSSFS